MSEIYLAICDKCPKFYSEKINPDCKLELIVVTHALCDGR